MPPAGGGDEWTGEGGGPPMRRGVFGRSVAAGENLGAEFGNRKRKAAVMSGDTGSLDGNGEHSKVVCRDSQRILKEIEDLRAQLDEDVKELGYCEANQKLRVELALKVKEIQCLREKNEEIQAKHVSMRKLNEELQAKNDGLVKQNVALQTSNDGMKMVNREPQAKNGCLTMQNEELKAKNDGLTQQNGSLMKQSEELQAKADGLMKQNEDLEAKYDGLRKQNEMLQAKNVSLTKWIEELEAKNEDQKKLSEELQAKNISLTKWNEDMQAKNGSLTEGNEELQAKKDSLKKQNQELQAKNDSMRKWVKELQAMNKDLQKNITEILENEIDTKRKHLLQFEELFSTVDFPLPQLEEGPRLLHKSSVEGHEGDGLTGCTDTGTKNSWDLESVPCLKQAEPTLCQAPSSFEEIGRLQAHVTKLETAFDQLIAHRTPVATKAALKVAVAAYAADLERTREKIEELEFEKAMMQQVQDVPDIDPDDTHLDTRICDLMVTGHMSKSSSKKSKEHRRGTKTTKKVDVPDIDPDDTDLDTRICDLMVTGHKSKSSSKKSEEHRRGTKTNKKVSP
ncbi:unnamed protein product [Urochloa humidicola]